MANAGETLTETIQAKLSAAFEPDFISIVDESENHRGHGGWREGGGTHFRVEMRSAAFDGMGRVERSRAVHRVLHEELAGRVHALALDLSGSAA